VFIKKPIIKEQKIFTTQEATAEKTDEVKKEGTPEVGNEKKVDLKEPPKSDGGK
jgi:hypothetical protein